MTASEAVDLHLKACEQYYGEADPALRSEVAKRRAARAFRTAFGSGLLAAADAAEWISAAHAWAAARLAEGCTWPGRMLSVNDLVSPEFLRRWGGEIPRKRREIPEPIVEDASPALPASSPEWEKVYAELRRLLGSLAEHWLEPTQCVVSVQFLGDAGIVHCAGYVRTFLIRHRWTDGRTLVKVMADVAREVLQRPNLQLRFFRERTLVEVPRDA